MAKKILDPKDYVKKDFWQNTIDSTKALIEQTELYYATLKKVSKLSKDKLLNTKATDYKGLKTANTEIEKLNKSFNQKLEIDKQRIKLEQALNIANSEQVKQNVQIKLQLAEQNKLNKQIETQKLKDLGVIKKTLAERNREIKAAQKLRKSTVDNANAYKVLTKRVNIAQARFKRLAAQYGETDSRTQKALNTFEKLDSRLRKINKTAKDGRRDVGRYGIAMQELGGGLKTLFLAGGVIGVIRGIGRAFGDAFSRIREFDKELQNIAGISGKSRSELKGLEKDIISVAGSSIKTSNEVAKLAGTLFTLGNSEREVRLLLKPVNDLSIALGTTSEEAADFLGQTLNAFGKGAESGQEFADIIANVRTSTSLDFQRIKDALGFVAPTANALGLSLGEVSAQIGVLQDNGIKAARAGRLLSSSFLKLADSGISLESALKKISDAQARGVDELELLRIAGGLFGKESAALGLVLAENTERTAELAAEFDNLSEGSLKTLTDQQLESLDAKLKIVDSSWEKLILNIEKGDGKIGRAIKSSLDALSSFLNFVSEGEKTRTQIVNEEGEKRASNLINGINKESKTEKERIENLKNLRASALRNIRGFNQDVGKAQRELFTELNKTSTLTGNKGVKKSLEEIKKAFDDDVLGLRGEEFDTGLNSVKNLVEGFEDLGNANTKVSLAVVNRVKEEKLLLAIEEELNEVELKSLDGKGKLEGKTKELTGLINKQAKAVSDLNTQIKESNNEENILSLGIKLDKAEEELKRLKRIASSTIEEIDKIERDLIQDSTERRIAQEIAKSEKLIETIESNSRIEESKKKELITAENDRLASFINQEELKASQERIKRDADFARAEFEARRTGFKTEEAFEKEKAEQFKAIRINAIKEEIKAIKQFGGEAGKLRIKQLENELESFNKLGKEKIKTEIDVVEVLSALNDKYFEGKSERIDEEISDAKARETQLQNLAAQGNREAAKSLGENEKAQAEANRKKEELLQREKQFELALAVVNTFNSELDSGESTEDALGKAILSTSFLTAAIASLPAFLKGTDDTGSGGDIDGKGGFLSVIHPNEQIYSKEDRKDLGFRDREGVKNIVKAYDNGLLQDMQQLNTPNVSVVEHSWQSNREILNKFDSLEAQLEKLNSKENYLGSDVDTIRDLIHRTYQKGSTKKIVTSKAPSIW